MRKLLKPNQRVLCCVSLFTLTGIIGASTIFPEIYTINTPGNAKQDDITK